LNSGKYTSAKNFRAQDKVLNKKSEAAVTIKTCKLSFLEFTEATPLL